MNFFLQACHFILEQSNCAILVVEDQKQLEKVLHNTAQLYTVL